jgi:hypothetical protein
MFSFSDLLTDFNTSLLIGSVSFVAGVVLSTKVTDFAKGVPGELRSALGGVEKEALAKVNAAKSEVIATITGGKVASPPVAVSAPVAPVAPVAAPAVEAAPAPDAPTTA